MYICKVLVNYGVILVVGVLVLGFVGGDLVVRVFDILSFVILFILCVLLILYVFVNLFLYFGFREGVFYVF